MLARFALAALLLLLLLLLCLTPLAVAEVSVDGIRVPDRTVAGKPFDVSVRISNDGPAMTVNLFGALYVGESPASSPCGPATDPRFRRFTHLVQEPVELPANGVVEYPPPGDRWQHRYEPSDVAAAPSVAELCVFVARESSTPAIQYEAFATTPLGVRGENRAPDASFTWTPREPRATEDATFEASATDAEADPISFRWDFGHANASGRAVAEGARVTHFFFPEGEYVVTLYASDGLHEAPVTGTVRVRAADAPDERGSLMPWPASALLFVGLGLAWLLRGQRR